ncbi:MAG TPA: M28 family peptidase [Bacteroidales bacterium]|nr:M28 family peptidase [Bacteroidales bacterium]HQN81670.1 M28 family peptidase [Bacteroidales bacterium]HQP64310.1 M28 family peptidase [Bacteroidales bacterium]
MKKICFLFVLFFLTGLSTLLYAQQTDAHTGSRIRLRKHISFLASDSLHGRLIGTEGNLIAGEYIAACFADAGIDEFNGASYFHYFDVKIPSVVPDIPIAVIEGCNIIGILPGTHPVLKEEIIVIGAHFDHLGMASGLASDKDSIYNGADDNASGTAVMIELAGLLKEQGGLSRTVVFAAFDGEEQGLLGSEQFIIDSLFPQERIRTMISLDMVGYYRTSGVLKILGAGTIENFHDLLPQTKTLKVRTVRYEISPFTATDTKPFASAGIPTLHITTGSRSPYHKVEDQADAIDYDGMAAVTGYVHKLVSAMGNDAYVTPSGNYSVLHYVPSYTFSWGPASALGTNRFVHTRGALEGKTAFYASLGADFRFLWKGYLEMNPGINLEYIGARHAAYPGISFMNRIQMCALNVPLSLRVYLPEFNKLPVGVYAWATIYYRYYIAGQTFDPDFIFSDVFKRHEWGVGLGIGVRASVFQVGFETRWGMTGLFRPGVLPGYNVKNNTQTIRFSYFF